MQTVIMDYESAKLYIGNHEDFGNEIDIEEKIYEKFYFKSSSIEWMSGENISLEFLS